MKATGFGTGVQIWWTLCLYCSRFLSLMFDAKNALQCLACDNIYFFFLLPLFKNKINYRKYWESKNPNWKLWIDSARFILKRWRNGLGRVRVFCSSSNKNDFFSRKLENQCLILYNLYDGINSMPNKTSQPHQLDQLFVNSSPWGLFIYIFFLLRKKEPIDWAWMIFWLLQGEIRTQGFRWQLIGKASSRASQYIFFPLVFFLQNYRSSSDWMKLILVVVI